MLYSIKQITLRNGDEIFIPLAKEESKWYDVIGKKMTKWERIVKIYNTYQLLNIFEDEDNLGLTYEDCIDHIEEFKSMIETRQGLYVSEIVMMKYIDKEQILKLVQK